MHKFFVLSVSVVLCLIVAAGCKKNGNSSDAKAYAKAQAYYRDQEYEKALPIFLELAEKGNPKAQGYAGIIYSDWNKEYDKSVYWYEKSAKSGLVMGMLGLGEAYRLGLGVQMDCIKSLYWYEMAAEVDSSLANYTLSGMYHNGICVGRDDSMRSKYLLDCTKKDDTYGLLCRAVVLYEGVGGDTDFDSARVLLLDLSKKSNSSAYFYLYKLYYNGNGVKKDVNKALMYLEMSSNLGMDAASYLLAVMYYNGEDVKRDYSKALHYALDSAERNSGSACLLGTLYELGLGVSKNSKEALKWYRQAAEKGHKLAAKRLSALEQ